MSKGRSVPAFAAGSLIVGALAVLVWLTVGGLPWPARGYTVVLVVLLPLLSIGQLRLGEEVIREIPRFSLYVSSAASLWLLALGALAAIALSRIDPAEIGLVTVGIGPLIVWSGAAFGVALGLAGLGHLLGVRESAILRHLLPESRVERIGFFGLSVSAGFCEELVFRGFLVTALSAATGSIAGSVVLSGIVFGSLHAYQGARGAARAALLGLLLTVPLLATGSLLPSMIAHLAYDVVAGLWLGPRLLERSR